MAKYRITVEFITQLSREVDANFLSDAEQMAEDMFTEYQGGEGRNVVTTRWSRHVELVSADEPRTQHRFRPAGE
jgi:hypothetical protein